MKLAGMKALTLHQPWASAIALGLKHYETRSWATRYRGWLAIHAGLTRSPLLDDMLRSYQIDAEQLPRGAIVAIAQLADCRRMDPLFIEQMTDLERQLGFWSVDRYAWKLKAVRAIDPIPCTGKQGLWNVPEPILQNSVIQLEQNGFANPDLK